MGEGTNKIFKIAIDGPAAAGKSTTASLLASRLGFTYIDSGAIYRSLTWKAIQCNLDPSNPEHWPLIMDLLTSLKFTYRIEQMETKIKNENNVYISQTRPVFIVQMDGVDAPDSEIRSPLISQQVGKIAKLPEFRKKIVELQRLFAAQLPAGSSPLPSANLDTKNTPSSYVHGVVIDGRDIGSVVLADAELKFFIKADPQVRAQRRVDELELKSGSKVDVSSVYDDLMRRDKEDETRTASPLIQSADAIVIDSTNMSVEDILKVYIDQVLLLWPNALSRMQRPID